MASAANSFSYPDQHATFETLLAYESHLFAAERVRTAAGYDSAVLETYCLALHHRCAAPLRLPIFPHHGPTGGFFRDGKPLRW